jgi:uncharacterized SAM-binding protein YcdF (DUF218 family)
MTVDGSSKDMFQSSAGGATMGADAPSAPLRNNHHRQTRGVTSRLRRLLTLAGWVLGAGVILLLVGYILFARLLAVREPIGIAQADAIVALTGGSNRIGDAIDLLQTRHGKRLLISGVNEKTTREELARLHPAGRDMISCCVDLDYRARNTIGNAIEARRWARANNFGSMLVVTSNYHLPRTMLEFQHAMPGIRLTAHPVVNDMMAAERWWRDPGVARIVWIEYMKYLVAWARSQIEGDPETSRLSIIVGGRKPVSPRGHDAIRPQDSRILTDTAPRRSSS